MQDLGYIWKSRDRSFPGRTIYQVYLSSFLYISRPSLSHSHPNIHFLPYF